MLVIKVNYNKIMRNLREEHNLTQEDVAKSIGINRVQYNQYENDYYSIPVKHLNKIAVFYNVSVDYLLGFTDNLNYKNISSEIDNIKAGIRLKEFRKEYKLTQVKLASILNTTFSSIAFNEKGRNLIATPFLYTICKKYGVSADYLLGKIDYQPKL